MPIINVKKKLLLSFFAIMLVLYLQAQCPQSGLKVQSKTCENPREIAITSLTCTELKIGWTGNGNQSYVIKAYNSADSTKKLEISAPFCDNSTCTSTIKVTPGVVINWSVQTVCTSNGATLLSAPVIGPEATIPSCTDANDIEIQLYPNPSKGFINISYYGIIEDHLTLNVYDVAGKKILTESRTSTSKGGSTYTMDLHHLSSGTYLLEADNGKEKKQVKFVIAR